MRAAAAILVAAVALLAAGVVWSHELGTIVGVVLLLLGLLHAHDSVTPPAGERPRG